jgi:hypothetical protein
MTPAGPHTATTVNDSKTIAAPLLASAILVVVLLILPL